MCGIRAIVCVLDVDGTRTSLFIENLYFYPKNNMRTRSICINAVDGYTAVRRSTKNGENSIDRVHSRVCFTRCASVQFSLVDSRGVIAHCTHTSEFRFQPAQFMQSLCVRVCVLAKCVFFNGKIRSHALYFLAHYVSFE